MTASHNIEHGSVVRSTCIWCNQPVVLAGWMGEQCQESAVYVHDYPERHPEEPERCIGTPDANSRMAYEVATPREQANITAPSLSSTSPKEANDEQ